MKTISQRALSAIAALFLSATSAPAIEGLELWVRCPDVVLSWPSTNGETYLVQFRPTLDTNSSWQTLTNYMPPDTGTNMTVFVHSNRVDCPPGQVLGLLSGENVLTSSSSVTISLVERQRIFKAREEARLAALFEKCLSENREPYEWELNNTPPLPPSPEEVRDRILKAKAARLLGLSITGDSAESSGSEPEGGSGSGDSPDCGFYRVVRNGLHLGGVQSGAVLSGTVEFPYEIGASNIGSPSVHLYANGLALPRVVSEVSDLGQRVLQWNTAFTPNGIYQIYALCDFEDEPIYSRTNTVVVTNLVQFNEFMTDFGSQIWVYAELAVPEADVFIDVYSEEEEYIGTFADSTTNGIISFPWDLTDPLGQPLTNETFHAVFNVSLAGAGSGGGGTNPPPWMTNSAHIQWNKQHGWFSDDFVVAWGAAPPFGFSTYFEGIVQEGVVDILANPGTDYPYNLSPGNTFNGTVFKLVPASRTNLLNYLSQERYRNFFYYGHGNSSTIGDLAPGGEYLVKLEEHDIRTALGNLENEKINHPYRFVFLHTCNSANGTLCDAFGIPRQSLPRSAFMNKGVKATAFVGFFEVYPFPSTPLQVAGCKAMVGQFFAEWRDGATLSGIVERAKQHSVFPLHPSAGIWGAYNLYRFYPY